MSPGEVYTRFADALQSVGAITKASQNKHHGYAYRGIDDVMNALHGVLAQHGLFYVPRLVSQEYEEWKTAGGKRLQVARVTYEFVFYAPDGSSLTVGPVVGQSADTDDKAPMQALSQAAKPALLHAFCIPTEDMADGDSQSPLSDAGGRVAADDPVDLGPLHQLIGAAKAAGLEGDYDATLAWAAERQVNADQAVSKLRKALAKHNEGSSAGATGEGASAEATQEQTA